MTTAAELKAVLPNYVAGTWDIDPVHSDVSFMVRHMMVSKVRGRFTTFSGEITTGENPLESSVTAEIDLASIDTGNEDRDNHVRSADFFEADAHPKMTYRSTAIRQSGDKYILDGELTIKGVTRNVSLDLEVNGLGPDAYGGTRVGFSATGELNRKDFGVNFNATMETGGVVVGDKVQLLLEIEAVLRAS
ncbi:MAG: YceI family protein [Acidimicrobiales bacterium]